MTETWNTSEISQSVPVGKHMELRVEGYRNVHDVMAWRWRLLVIRPSSAALEIATDEIRDVAGVEYARQLAVEACSEWLGDTGDGLGRAYGSQTSDCVEASVADFDAGDDESPWIVQAHHEYMRRGPFTLSLSAQAQHQYGAGDSQVIAKAWQVALTFVSRSYNNGVIEIGSKRMTWRPQSEARLAAATWAHELMETFRNPFAEPPSSEPEP